jgi:hypothetical protein
VPVLPQQVGYRIETPQDWGEKDEADQSPDASDYGHHSHGDAGDHRYDVSTAHEYVVSRHALASASYIE